MRTLIAVLLLAITPRVTSGEDVGVSAWPFGPLPDPPVPITFNYDVESLAGTFVLGFGPAEISLDIVNAFELPEYEPPGGFFLQEGTVLTSELAVFEVDTAGERAVYLTFSIGW